MSPVFSHGRLRLYLLKLLNEGPKHGYELIRLLENRFLGLYAPSAGTIYPRLQRMEADGLVTHEAVGGRKTYKITERGVAELTARGAELDGLESEISASVADLSSLADEVQRGVSGSVRDIKRELRQVGRQVEAERGGHGRDRSKERSAAGRSGAEQDQLVADLVVELEQRATQLLAEVRRRTRAGMIGVEGARASVIVVEAALDQVRRLLR